uniref:Uncharacterized protein n=1 Tax=Rhizophora mucronata TaxID=61149 RepID=A0A2P2P9H1_RHIMU
MGVLILTTLINITWLAIQNTFSDLDRRINWGR